MITIASTIVLTSCLLGGPENMRSLERRSSQDPDDPKVAHALHYSRRRVGQNDLSLFSKGFEQIRATLLARSNLEKYAHFVRSEKTGDRFVVLRVPDEKDEDQFNYYFLTERPLGGRFFRGRFGGRLRSVSSRQGNRFVSEKGRVFMVRRIWLLGFGIESYSFAPGEARAWVQELRAGEISDDLRSFYLFHEDTLIRLLERERISQESILSRNLEIGVFRGRSLEKRFVVLRGKKALARAFSLDSNEMYELPNDKFPHGSYLELESGEVLRLGFPIEYAIPMM